MPEYISELIKSKFKGNEDIITFNLYRIEMILWFYCSIHNNVDNRKLYAVLLLEYVWDNLLTTFEQYSLITTASDKIIEEQVVKSDRSSYFRYINLQSPNNLVYLGKDSKPIAPSIVEFLEKDEPLIKANIETSGKGYGFIVPIKGVLTFKTNSTVAQVGKDPEGGQGCKIISTLKPHAEALMYLGSILKEVINSDLDLNKQSFESTSLRYFKNVQRYCALREIVLRFMDAKKIKNLRWFYRPISAYKSKHIKK